MWSQPKPMPPAPAIRPLPRLDPTPAGRDIQAILHECDGWLARLVDKYGLPRAALCRMLHRPGDLEQEIATWLIERAQIVGRQYFSADETPPDGNDLFSRAVRGVYGRLAAQRDAAAAVEKQRQYAETDDLLRRIRAGEDVDL